VITKEQYDQACNDAKKAGEIQALYFRQKQVAADLRYGDFVHQKKHYNDEDLFYSRVALCPCGHGLAYIKECGSQRFWDCSAIFKGIADLTIEHSAQLPFAFYDIKGEQDYNGKVSTTRGVFRPRSVK
jgi:hypothetical protein